MAVPPIQYRATDYPPQYRPLGYWRHARRRDQGAGEAPAPRRRRWWALLTVLLATLVLHAGIAAAYLTDSGDTTTSSAQPAQKGARCNVPGEPDPSATVPPNPSQDSPDSGQGGQDGGGTADPSDAGGGNSRGAL